MTPSVRASVRLQAPLPDSRVLLVVEGRADRRLLFSDQSWLPVSEPMVSSFIQLDKPRYRPGDTVRIRVVSVGAERRPHPTCPVRLLIKVRS